MDLYTPLDGKCRVGVSCRTALARWMMQLFCLGKIREIPVSLNKRFPVTGYDHDGGARTTV